MIVINGKEISAVYYGSKEISTVYEGVNVLWELIKSCFGRGIWMSDKLWVSDDLWKNNN